MHTKLVLAYIGYLPDNASSLVNSTIKRKAKLGLRKETCKYYKLPESLKFEIEMKWGNAAQELIKTAKAYKNPMLVIGKSGRNAIGRVFLGSTAEQLAVTSPYPVFIQKKSKITFPRTALVAVDLTKNSKNLTKWSAQFAKENRISATGLFASAPIVPILDLMTYQQVYEEVEQIRQKDFRKLQKEEPRIMLSFKTGDPITVLLAASKKSDLLILRPHNRPIFFPTLGSVSAKVVRRCATNVLIVPSKTA